MCTFFPSSIHTAQKKYRDNSYEALYNDLRNWWPLMTYSEKKLFVQAKQRDGFIMPGMKYLKQPQIADGDFCVYRGCIELNSIVERLDVFADYDC